MNDKCSFPTTLNVESYTKTGINAKEDPSQQQQAEHKSHTPIPQQEMELHAANQYEYNLIGILIHAGDGANGHYYSLVKDPTCAQPKSPNGERGNEANWIEFNDHIVRPFDPANISSEAYEFFT